MSGRDGGSNDEGADDERRERGDQRERQPRRGNAESDRPKPVDGRARPTGDDSRGKHPQGRHSQPPTPPPHGQPSAQPPQNQPPTPPPHGQPPDRPHRRQQTDPPPQTAHAARQSGDRSAPPAPRVSVGRVPHRRGPRGGRSPRSRLRRLRTSATNTDEETSWDPVQVAFAGRVDLYDIATWEVRTPLDSFAVSVTNALRTGRTVLLVAVALALFLTQAAVAALIVLEEPAIGVLAVSSVLPAVAVAGYLWYDDPTRREPFVTLAATFVLSMLFASFAGVINTALGPTFEVLGIFGLLAFYFVIVGPIEEFVKWLAIRVYAYRTDTFRTVIDGVIYGAVAGVGFAAIENLIYIVVIYLEAGEAAGIDSTEAATMVAAQRSFVGPGHVVFSAWAGFYLGLAKFNPEHRGPIVVKGLLIAAFIHALYNTSVSALGESLPVLGLFGFIVLYHGFWFTLLYRKVRAYRELYRARFPSGLPRHVGRTRRAGRSREAGRSRRSGQSGQPHAARDQRRTRQ